MITGNSYFSYINAFKVLNKYKRVDIKNIIDFLEALQKLVTEPNENLMIRDKDILSNIGLILEQIPVLHNDKPLRPETVSSVMSNISSYVDKSLSALTKAFNTYFKKLCSEAIECYKACRYDEAINKYDAILDAESTYGLNKLNDEILVTATFNRARAIDQKSRSLKENFSKETVLAIIEKYNEVLKISPDHQKSLRYRCELEEYLESIKPFVSSCWEEVSVLGAEQKYTSMLQIMEETD